LVSSQRPSEPRQIWVCQHRNCQAQGSEALLAAFVTAMAGEQGTVQGCECQGQCNLGATVRVLPDQLWYCRVKITDVPEIIEAMRGDRPVDRLLHPRLHG
jgi:(2Fe-2S) ferredoxin